MWLNENKLQSKLIRRTSKVFANGNKSMLSPKDVENPLNHYFSYNHSMVIYNDSDDSSYVTFNVNIPTSYVIVVTKKCLEEAIKQSPVHHNNKCHKSACIMLWRHSSATSILRKTTTSSDFQQTTFVFPIIFLFCFNFLSNCKIVLSSESFLTDTHKS